MTMKISLSTFFGLLIWLNAFSQSNVQGLPFLRLEIKPAEYCLGSVYNGGFMCVQSGIKAETFLLGGKLIPEVQYNRGLFDLEKLSFPNDYMKPFSDLRFGVRMGKYFEGRSTFRKLRCIDHAEKEGDIITVYYEEENVHGDLHVGFTAGMYMSRSFLKSGFTTESGIDASVSLNSTSVYAGFAMTKIIDNKAKQYSSGNVCTWDKYALYYFNVLYSLQHKIGDSYYVGGLPTSIAGQAYPFQADVSDKLLDFRPFGISMGFVGGRWRRGFVGSYEVGMIPSLKGKGFFVKIGASYALGIGKQ